MQKLDLQMLEGWLWESANIMRGTVDSSDYKNYIFGILLINGVQCCKWSSMIKSLRTAFRILLFLTVAFAIPVHAQFSADRRK